MVVTLFIITIQSNLSKGRGEVSVLEMCPYKRGHYNNVTFTTPHLQS